MHVYAHLRIFTDFCFSAIAVPIFSFISCKS